MFHSIDILYIKNRPFLHLKYHGDNVTYLPNCSRRLKSVACCFHFSPSFVDRAREAGPIFEKALQEAQKLTREDWVRAYPGNDSRIARQGLTSMIASLEYNLSLTVDK